VKIEVTANEEAGTNSRWGSLHFMTENKVLCPKPYRTNLFIIE